MHLTINKDAQKEKKDIQMLHKNTFDKDTKKTQSKK